MIFFPYVVLFACFFFFHLLWLQKNHNGFESSNNDRDKRWTHFRHILHFESVRLADFQSWGIKGKNFL